MRSFFLRLVALGFRNSFRRPTRTIICVIGIALCIMLILTTAAISQRYNQIVNQSFGIYSTNIVVISKGSLLLGGLPIGAEIPETESSQIQAASGVSSVIPMLVVVSVHQLVPANVTIGIPLGNFSSIGSGSSSPITGSYPKNESQIMVGSYLAQISNLKVGSVVTVGGSSLIVSGIVTSPNVVLQSAEIMPLQTAQATQGYNGLVSAFLVTTAGGASNSEVIQNINSRTSGLLAIDPQNSASLANPLVATLGALNLGIDVFSSLVAFLFVAVIAVVNLNEQKDELSTIRAIGSSSLSVLKVTLSEIGLVVSIGAIIGLALATVATALIFQYYGGVPITFSFITILGTIPGVTILGAELGIVGFGLLISAVTTSVLLRKMS